MSSFLLAKSRTKVSTLPVQVRFNLDSVCTALTPFSFLSHDHRMQQRLVKAGLVLLGNDQHIEMVVELRLGLRFGDVRSIRTNIQFRLGILLITVLHSTRKGHQHLHIVVLLLLYVAFDLVVVAHCRKGGTR